MSAPKTDPEKQAKLHKTPLAGIASTLIWAGALLVGLIVVLFVFGNEPGNETPVEAEDAQTADTPAEPPDAE